MRQFVFLHHRWRALVAIPFACVSVVHAARPLVTDDARILDPHTCQLESGYRHDHDGHEWTAAPACNPTGFFDATLGLARADPQGATSERLTLQAKTVLRPALANDWGIGLTVGTVDQLRPGGSSRFGETYFNVPVTLSWRDDEVLLHMNVGVNRNRYAEGTRATWATATELAVTSRLALLAETVGTDQGRPYWQTGARFTLLPNFMQIDATLGGEWRGSARTRWWSMGVRLVTSPL